MICPNCHREIVDNSQYCSYCGKKIHRCGYCNQPLISGTKFCTYCGRPVEEQTDSHQNERGFYQPIHTFPIQKEKKQEIPFREIQVNNHVNYKVLIVSFTLLVILTLASYIYVYHTPNNQLVDRPTRQEPVAIVIKVDGSISTSSMIGNINQSGHVAIDGDDVYIVNNQGTIVKMDSLLRNQTELVKGDNHYIYVKDKTVYYVDSQYQLCSITNEGKDQQVILNQAMYYVFFQGDKVYYQLDDDGEKIYVYDFKTKENKKINERRSYCLNVVEDKIYYNSTSNIYVIDIDGKNEEKIIEGDCHDLIYYNQRLYYSKDGHIEEYDIETKQSRTIISERSQLMNISDDNMYGDYLFYITLDGLKRYDFNTQETATIYDSYCKSCEILGNKLVLTIETYGSSYQLIMSFDGQQQYRLFQNNDGNYI